jgi:hypothetical protein
VIDLSRMMTILDVAELTGLCWDTVKGIIKKRLANDYAHIRLKDLRRLAIDGSTWGAEEVPDAGHRPGKQSDRVGRKERPGRRC